MGKTITVTATADVDLSDFDNEDLIEELERRSLDTLRTRAQRIYNMDSAGADPKAIADEALALCRDLLGKIV